MTRTWNHQHRPLARLGLGGLLLATVSGWAGQADALEVSVSTRLQGINDGGIKWFSPDGTVSGLALTVEGMLRPSTRNLTPGLAWSLGYDLQGADNAQRYSYNSTVEQGGADCYYDYYSSYACSADMEGSLQLHTLTPGVKVVFPVSSWLELHAGLALAGTYGSLSLSDSGTDWTMIDPQDPDEEAILYQSKPYTASGLGGGGQAGLGFTLWLNPGPKKAPTAEGFAPAPQDSADAAMRFRVGFSLDLGYRVMMPTSFGQVGTLDTSGSWMNAGVAVGF